jgi:RimJ/RimL family protein N-acetyltransferase
MVIGILSFARIKSFVIIEPKGRFSVTRGINEPQLTARLRLVPAGPEQVTDLVAIHRDALVAEWYAGEWSTARAEEFARGCARGWSVDGVGKWIAYDRATGRLVGRGGLSRMTNGAVNAQISALAGPAWAAERLELGWAVREEFRGRGLATEIGQAGLGFGFDVLGARAVVSFTERHNVASRGVMERLGMRLAGEIRARGLVEGKSGEQDGAPFAVYAVER